MKRLDQLIQQRADLVEEADKLGNLDEPTEETNARLNAIPSEMAALDNEIANLEKLREQMRAEPAVPDLNQPTLAQRKILHNAEVKENFEDDPKRGFKDHSEFLGAVLHSYRFGSTDKRLAPLQVQSVPTVGATAGSDEQHTLADPYGGFSIPPSFVSGLKMVGLDEGGFVGMATQIPMQTDRVVIPAKVDKNHSSSVSGGLTVARKADTESITASRMEIEQIELQAFELIGLTYASELLLRASPMTWIALIQQGFRDEFTAKLINEMINGTGVGEFLGIVNSPALISVAESGSQTTDTIIGANIVAMRSRAWRYDRCIWMANPDTLPQLAECRLPGDNSDVFLFQPGRGIDVPDTLMGRPVYFSDYAQSIGAVGDVMCINWNEYLIGTLHGMMSAQSIHVRFENNEQTFKFWMANGGAPWWRSAFTPAVSSTTRSPFVALAERN